MNCSPLWLVYRYGLVSWSSYAEYCLSFGIFIVSFPYNNHKRAVDYSPTHQTNAQLPVAAMRPLHTATRSADSTLRKTNSRVVLQIQEFSQGAQAPDINRRGAVNSKFVSRCDTLFILLGIAICLSIVGMLFVHKLFVDSSAAGYSSSLPGDPEVFSDAAWTGQG